MRRPAESRQSRRDFLARTAVAAASANTVALAARTVRRATAKRVLILGGTRFLGPAIVRAARARRHEVTLFNRGRSNPSIFPELEQIRGDRRTDLNRLAGRRWDTVIDTCGYYTADVEESVAALAEHCDQYVFISTIGVYSGIGTAAATYEETSPLVTTPDPYTRAAGHYAELKACCERAVEAGMDGRQTIIRPTYIVGPGDLSRRFTYWPMRIREGGHVLAPGAPDNELQVIDVRDLGEWIITSLEQQHFGTYNASGFGSTDGVGRLSMAECLHTAKATLNYATRFTWVSDAFLLEHGVTSWGDLPGWTPQAETFHIDCTKAVERGLQFRPWAATMQDTAAWCVRAGEAVWREAGLTRAREKELLSLWRG